MSDNPAGEIYSDNPNDPELLAKHARAEAMVKGFHYAKPEGVKAGKGSVNLARTDLLRVSVQIVKKNGGENNLHFHDNGDSFWMVLSGRVRFYGPDDVVTGEYGPMEGTVTPAFSRYWFENVGEGDLELMHVSALKDTHLRKSGRTDLSKQKYEVGSSDKFDARKAL